jgi:hypothetical protein
MCLSYEFKYRIRILKMDIETFGAIKIMDGLFIGDEFAAQDLEFVVTNKITHIINTAGR